MLIQFRFKNFKSFKDEAILDLSATKITEHADRLIKLGNEKLLTASAIFGANASGKSNVIKAFRFMERYVMESFSYGGDSGDKKSQTRMLTYTPFLFDNASSNQASLFEVYFIDERENGCRFYNYGFTLDHDGIVEEWLNTKAKTAKEYKSIFYRDRNELDLSGLPRTNQENIKSALEKEALVVSLGAKLKVTQLKRVRDWFYRNNCTSFGDPFENVFLSSLLPENFVHDKKVQDKVVRFFSTFDPSIIGFQVETAKEDPDHMQPVKIETIHRKNDGSTTKLPLKDESDGTLKMFALYPLLDDTLNNGSVLFVDELNARLHPLLVRNFLLTFLNPETNPKHAQLVFTTHDSWQLANNMLRRDEIWFVEKNLSGESSLYSLADFYDEDGVKIRKDESFEKNYLCGKYGAIPSLGYIDVFKGE